MAIDSIRRNYKIIAIFIIVSILVGVFTLYISRLNKTVTKNSESPTISPANTQPQSSKPSKNEKVSGQIIVKFKENISEAQIAERLKSYNARIKGKIEGINYTIVEVPVGQEDAVLQKLATDPIVKYAEPDYIQTIQLSPNDPLFSEQWGLFNTGQPVSLDGFSQNGTPGADIHIENAWNVTKGAGVKVAVLDTGIDLSHPDVGSKVVAQKVFATSSINDVHGHGTHVAGIIAAITDNGQGVSGVCPDCQLIIGKIQDDQGIGSTSIASTGITWAADNGAKVISLSVGGDTPSQAQTDAINYAWSKGAVVVAAAGNQSTSTPFYPAASDHVISVGATDNTDTLASFSNFGTWVKVTAPGVGIKSTYPTAKNSYGILSGTSQATPIVSGVVGLLFASQYGTSNASVVQRLYDTADKIAGTGQSWQFGRINAEKALAGAPVASGPTISSGPTPTFVCGGSTNSICPTPTSITTNNTQLPSGTDPLLNPPDIANNGFPTFAYAPIPCPTTGTGSVQNVKQHKHPRGGVSGFMGLIMRFFLELLNMLLNLAGGNGNISLPPGLSANPCQSPMPMLPSSAPSAAVIPVPSTIVPSPTGMTPAPSSAGQTTTMNVHITGFGWPDNNPPGAGIAYPLIHQKAGGTGTFADPITFAANKGAIWTPGVKLYAPYLQKYLIMENECGTCPDNGIDIWVNSDASADAASVRQCEGQLNKDSEPLQVNPQDGQSVASQPLYDIATNTCHVGGN